MCGQMSSCHRKFSGAGAKGQMFLIGAIMVVVTLVLIRTSIDVGDVLEKKSFLEAGLEELEFANIRSEVPKSAFNAINYTQNMTNVTNSFVSFAESKLSARSVQLDGVTVNSQYKNLTASSNILMNVTFYNFFDVDVSRAIVNLSTDYGAPITFNDIAPGATRATDFTLNLGSSQNLSLWVFYETSTEKVTANVTIPAEIGKTKFVGYFDLRMNSERGTIRDRFAETVAVD